jgi:hypothetical protein
MSIYEEYVEESLSRLRTVLDDSGTRPILFSGSGLSRRYLNSPDWIRLLEKLLELNPNKKFPIGYYTQDTKNDYPMVASAIVDEYQTFAWEQYRDNVFPKHLYDHSYSKSIFLKWQISKIFEELMNSFKIEGHTYSQELDILKTLQPHAIITTNYDCLLENLFPNFNVIIGQQVIKKKEATDIGHILKIHGCMTKPEEIVISQEDYKVFYEKQKYLSAKLLTYFMEHPVIFLGYSLTDENIKSILSDIAEIVSGESDEVVNNIWFIEWKKDDIPSDFRPPTDKTIDLGNGENIRINYLLVNSFERLYESLYQRSAMTLDVLRELQTNIYNIVKSKTITDLEVDMVSIQNITNEESLARLIGINGSEEKNQVSNQKIQLLGVGTIADAEQLMTIYPMRISQIAQKLGLSYWYYVDKIIKKIYSETGFNLKESNNRYHIDIGIKQSEHRYSMEALDLFKQILENGEYTVVNEQGIELTPNQN